MILKILVTIITLFASWTVYKKMGRQGWEGIVPLYRIYVLCSELYGNGWKMLFLLIPLYNIYFGIKLYIDFARAFHKGAGFALGLMFLPFLFLLILAFGDAQYGSGAQANTSEDFVSKTSDKAREFVSTPRKDGHALDKLEKLGELREKGILTEEEYLAKKDELLKRL